MFDKTHSTQGNLPIPQRAEACCQSFTPGGNLEKNEKII